MERQKTKIANTILTLPYFKTYYKVIVIKTAWYWQMNRQRDKWKRIESPARDPYSQLISDEGAKTIKGSKDSLFNQWLWNNQPSTSKEGRKGERERKERKEGKEGKKRKEKKEKKGRKERKEYFTLKIENNYFLTF